MAFRITGKFLEKLNDRFYMHNLNTLIYVYTNLTL